MFIWEGGSGLLNLVVGKRKKDSEGAWIEGDNNRFLFIFHDVQSMFYLSFSFFVVVCQYCTVYAMYQEFDVCTEVHVDKKNFYAVSLCVIFVSSLEHF